MTIDVIEASEEQTTSICPKGEAGLLGLSFRANGNDFQREIPPYFECDPFYKIKVEVSDAFEVTAKHDIK